MQTIGFTEAEIANVWRVVSGVLYFGNLVFTQNKRDDSAQIADVSCMAIVLYLFCSLFFFLVVVADKIAHVLGIKSPNLVQALLKPRVKTAKEWVNVSVNAAKVFSFLSSIQIY